MIPAFVNEAAGTAPAAMRALEETGGFEIHALAPSALEDSIRSEMASGPARIVVAGAGSIGCYAGGCLALAGRRVTLLARPRLVEAICQGGLRVSDLEARDRQVRSDALSATADPVAALSSADVILVTVKSGATVGMAGLIAAHAPEHAVVVSLQNGVDNGERLAAIIGRPVVPVAVYVATAMEGAGHVRHHGRGDLILGTGGEAVAAHLIAAGIPATVSDRVRDALWTKLAINCAWNALSALGGQPYGRLFASEGVAAVLADVTAECLAVAGASDVRLPEDMLAQVRAIAATMAGQRSSTAQDLARGRRTEIDHLNGFVVRAGERLGIPTPANRVLHTLVKLAEAGGR